MNEDNEARPRAAPFTRPLLAAAFAASAAVAPAADAAYDAFLSLDGIPGESTDKQHKGEINVIEFTDGFALATGAGSAAGRAAGKVICEGLTVKKYVDSASVKLIDRLFTGKTIAKGTLSVRRSGELSAKDFYTIDFGDSLVTAVSQAGGGDSSLLEAVTIQPSSYKFSYSVLNSDGNPTGTPITFSGSC
jgi:type VI secretion system secreted protein Hcp